MKIIELELTNFKGIRSLLLNFNGRDARIIGNNATGKTTVMDSFIWLLTGKDHLGRSDLNFNIKTLDVTGQAIPMLDHSVRAVLEHGGSTFELVRNFREVWQKKTGTNVQSFNGHKTEYYIDGVPKTEKEYTAFIERIAPMQLIYLLTMTGYFNEQIKADDRRRMLLDMCGDVDESAMLAQPEFAELAPHITKMVTVADLKKTKAAQKSKINDEIKSIPTAINVHMQYMDVGGINAKEEQKIIDNLSGAIKAGEQQLLSLDNGEALSAMRKELSELENEKLQFNILQEQAREKAASGLKTELLTAQDGAFEIGRKISKAESDLTALRLDLEVCEKKRQAALDEYYEVEDKAFDGSTVCPTCGRPLPPEKVSEAMEQFNENKARELEAIAEKGKAIAISIGKIKANIESTATLLDELRRKKEAADSEVNALQSKLADINNSPIPEFDCAKIDAKKSAIIDLMHSSDVLREKYIKQLESLKAARSEHESNILRLQNAENAAKEIKKLKAREKELAAAFEDCEKLIALCDNFTSAKVRMLDEKISGAFRFAKFKLTETLVNGGVREVCETLIDGVPYGAANNAARINIGLDIIETFSNHYGITLPVFVDNAESVCRLYPMDAGKEKPQIIQLIVPTPFEGLPVDLQDYMIDRWGSEDEAKRAYHMRRGAE